MHITNIFKTSYWFYQPFIAIGAVKWLWIIGFLVLVLVGLVAYIVRANKQYSDRVRGVLLRIGNFGAVTGLFGLLWMWFRQEAVPFLAWRFWLLLWLILFIWWGIKILYYIYKRVPAIQQELAHKIAKEKYLPKSR